MKTLSLISSSWSGSVILYNYITIYKSSPQYNTYKPEYITTRNLQDILFENGILEEKIDYTLNLFEKIKECNNNNCCAIIRVDMYEIPYHKGYFWFLFYWKDVPNYEWKHQITFCFLGLSYS